MIPFDGQFLELHIQLLVQRGVTFLEHLVLSPLVADGVKECLVVAPLLVTGRHRKPDQPDRVHRASDPSGGEPRWPRRTAKKGMTIYRAADSQELMESGYMTWPTMSDNARVTHGDTGWWAVEAPARAADRPPDARGGRFSLVHVWFKANTRSPPLHDSDCMYYVISGEAHMGNQVLRAGDSFFVPAEAPYVYTAGPDGVEVLEIRHDVAQFDMKIPGAPATRWQEMTEISVANRDRWSPSRPARRSPPTSRDWSESAQTAQLRGTRRTWTVPSPLVDPRSAWMVSEGRSRTNPGAAGRHGEGAEDRRARSRAVRSPGRVRRRRHRHHDARWPHPHLEPRRRTPLRCAAADVVGQPTTFLLPEELRDEFGESRNGSPDACGSSTTSRCACTRPGAASTSRSACRRCSTATE